MTVRQHNWLLSFENHILRLSKFAETIDMGISRALIVPTGSPISS